MRRTKSPITRASLGLLALPLILAYPPAVSFADEQPSPNTFEQAKTSQARPTEPTEPEKPTAPDPKSYHQNETTGKWENDRYSWDPATHQTEPKDHQDYNYNPDTGKWDTTEWRYEAETKQYEPNTPPVSHTATSSGDTPDKPATQGNTERTNPPIAPQNTSTGATSPRANSSFTGFYDANISNNISSSAQSGNAALAGNTKGGNANTGDATAISSIFNLLNSVAPFGDLSNVNTFVSNIDGNVVGDLLIDPRLLPATTAGSNLGSTVQVNNASNAAINNNVLLDATTGDATVNRNTAAGNATTGDANAVVNLVNMLNSSVATGQSFVGLLNINGDFNGDVLFPPSSLDALLAANTLATTTAQDQQGYANLTNNQSIHNAITSNASTGAAAVTNNTKAGNATTGTAATNVTLLNLTGHEVIGSDSLLVFVNVLGKWLGAIVNAPAGSTAAALGGNIAQHKVLDGDLNSTNNSGIDNNVTIGARSGNALVDHNTTAGNARSGDATTSVNVANVTNSNLSLSDWFGILFINVFGTWHGSFGINTAAGDPFSEPTNSGELYSSTPSYSETPQVFSFLAVRHSTVPSPANSEDQDGDVLAEEAVASTSQGHDDQREKNLVLESASPSKPQDSDIATSALAPTHRDLSISVAAVLLGGILVAIERVLAFRDRRKMRQNQIQ